MPPSTSAPAWPRSAGFWRALALCLLGSLAIVPAQAADGWEDISSGLTAQITNNGAKAPWPGGCSGVVVDRLTSAVTIKVVGGGLWRSADGTAPWTRIDQGVVSGRDETGWATSIDQNAPSRMASFSLDGDAGWTTNGLDWRRFTSMGRNWDFGSIDWASASPSIILAAKHETTPPGEVCLSTDGGNSWRSLSVRLNDRREKISMLGVMGAETLIYSRGEGIQRSADLGRTWAKVSDENPQTRIPVWFQGRHYLGTAAGLLVSEDRGASWRRQGGAVSLWLGPFFGPDAATMAAVGEKGVFLTRDSGATWTKVADHKSKAGGFEFSANWFGCYAWDAAHGRIFASAMGNPVYALHLP